jgi:hypothetical protein
MLQQQRQQQQHQLLALLLLQVSLVAPAASHDEFDKVMRGALQMQQLLTTLQLQYCKDSAAVAKSHPQGSPPAVHRV